MADVMKLVDKNLKTIFAQLTPAERRSLEAALRGERTQMADSILRRVKAQLKRLARRKRDAQHKHAQLSKHDARFFDLLN